MASRDASAASRSPFVADPDFMLYIGDALDVLRDLPSESVHCCVTSPPYWGLRDYGPKEQLGLEPTSHHYTARLVEIFHEVQRVLRNDGTLWLNLGDTYRAKELTGIPWIIAFALRADNWRLRSDIIWSKPNPMPESVTDRPTKAHEHVFLLSKSDQYFYDADAIREPAEWARWGDQTNAKYEGTDSAAGWIGARSKEDIQRKARGGGFSRKYAEQQPAHGLMRLDRPVDTGTRNARSVWEIATQTYPDAHFATFPEALPRRCILAGCPRGGVVLDPFMGSGTTAFVARSLGRRSVGVELNSVYAALCAKRLSQLSLLAESLRTVAE